MKLTLCLIFCATLISQHNGADGRIKDFFENVHNSLKDTVHKAHEGLDNLFHPSGNEKKTEESVVPTNGQTADVTKSTDPVPQKQDAADVTKSTDPVPQNQDAADVTKNTDPVPQNQDVKPVEATTQSTSTTTVKDGRENFSGACLPGYTRTADGRCKATF